MSFRYHISEKASIKMKRRPVGLISQYNQSTECDAPAIWIDTSRLRTFNDVQVYWIYDDWPEASPRSNKSVAGKQNRLLTNSHSLKARGTFKTTQNSYLVDGKEAGGMEAVSRLVADILI